MYEGSIDVLRNVLTQRLKWAINEVRTSRSERGADQFELSINEVRVLSERSGEELAVVRISPGPIQPASLVVRNISFEMSQPISHIYLFARQGSAIKPYQKLEGHRFPIQPVKAHRSDSVDGLGALYQLRGQIPSMPPETFETLKFWISIRGDAEEELRLRLHTSQRNYSYRFTIAAKDQNEG